MIIPVRIQFKWRDRILQRGSEFHERRYPRSETHHRGNTREQTNLRLIKTHNMITFVAYTKTVQTNVKKEFQGKTRMKKDLI